MNGSDGTFELEWINHWLEGDLIEWIEDKNG